MSEGARTLSRSNGKLRYSPKLLGENPSKWWVVLDCHKDIGVYYRHLHWLANHRCRQIQRPAWDVHITVVRDEEPPCKEFWEAYASEEVTFDYDPTIRTDGAYYWLEVVCPRLLDLRSELGLSREPEIPLHLSIGHGLT